jgi:hypothetical protein
MWGDKLKERYLNHPELGPYILYLEHPDEIPPDGVNVFTETHYPDYSFFRPPLKIAPFDASDPDFVLAKSGIGHNQPDGRLTGEQKELVWRHYPKIKKEAKKYSRGDPILLDDLLTVGIERAYELARQYNPNQGVTFGKFIEKYLWGAMRDHAKGARKIVNGLDQDKIDRLYFGRVATPAKKPDQIDSKKRWSKADRRTGSFFKGERIHSGRGREANRQLLSGMIERYREAGGTIGRPTLPHPLTEEVLAAAKLNKRQEMVYRECVEKNTPIEVMARRIGNLEGKTVDVSQVSRIKRQAVRKVEAAKIRLAKSVK